MGFLAHAFRSYKAMGDKDDKSFFEKCSHDCYWCGAYYRSC